MTASADPAFWLVAELAGTTVLEGLVDVVGPTGVWEPVVVWVPMGPPGVVVV
jgi:hypothetical protein